MTTYPNATHASQHLAWAELACKDGTPYPLEWRGTRGRQIADVFERIRAACGHQPITVASAFRTPSHNRRIGGAPKSQHLAGRALDLKPPQGWTVDAFYAVIRTLAQTTVPQIKGLGRYRTFVHVDIRPAARLVAWDGGAATKDAA